MSGLSGSRLRLMLRRRSGRFRHSSLRTRLILILVGSLLISCTALTVITSLALHAYLMNRLDQQLEAAGNRYSVSLEHPGDKDADDSDFGSVIGQQTGTLGARIANGTVTAAGIVTDESTTQSVSAADRAVIARLAVGGPRDVNLPALGEYRVIVSNGADGDLQVTGLPKRAVDQTIARLALIEIIVFAGAMLLTAVAGASCVRLTLRPLERVARTARSVTSLPLGKGEVQLPEPLQNDSPDTEVGQVTDAVNRMLQHVEAALAERQASEDLLRQFVADASHELRTPVAVIRSHAEYVQMTAPSLSADAGEALGRITAESVRMGVLVEDLLLLARLDSGRPLLRDSVDLTRLVLDNAIDARTLAPDHEWQLELPEHETLVSGDPNSLRQVVVNLLSNAAEHTPAGTVVTIQLAEQDGYAVAVVSDTGPGISAKLLPKIFERFVRADSARVHRGGESGLGLAIVEAIVRAHHGSITVDSRPGRTSFTLRLPLEQAAVPG